MKGKDVWNKINEFIWCKENGGKKLPDHIDGGTPPKSNLGFSFHMFSFTINNIILATEIAVDFPS